MQKNTKVESKFVSSYIFWIGAVLSAIFLSFLSTQSTIAALSILIFIIVAPFVWKMFADQKFTMLLILLTILPGMLGRFTTAPKSGTAILITDLLVVVLMLGFFMHKLVIDKKWKITKLHHAIFLFFGIAIISYFNGIYHLYDLGKIDLKEIIVSFLYLMRWLGYATIFFVVVEKIRTLKDLNYWIKALMWIAFFTAILGFLQLIFYPDFFEMFVNYGWDPHKDRLLGTFFDPNLIGAFLAFNLCLVTGIILHVKNKKWFVLLGIVLLIALALTLSRSAYLGFVGGFTLLALFRSRAILVIGMIIMFCGIALNPTIFDRISQGVSVDDSAQKHIDSWVDGIKLIKAYPITGIGYNMLPSVYDDLALIDEWDINNKSGIENSLFTIWVTTGIFGLLAFILIWGTTYLQSYKNWKDQTKNPIIRGINLGIMGGIITLIISSIFVNVLLFSYIVVFFWICAAISFASKDISN